MKQFTKSLWIFIIFTAVGCQKTSPAFNQNQKPENSINPNLLKIDLTNSEKEFLSRMNFSKIVLLDGWVCDSRNIVYGIAIDETGNAYWLERQHLEISICRIRHFKDSEKFLSIVEQINTTDPQKFKTIFDKNKCATTTLWVVDLKDNKLISIPLVFPENSKQWFAQNITSKDKDTVLKLKLYTMSKILDWWKRYNLYLNAAYISNGEEKLEYGDFRDIKEFIKSIFPDEGTV